MIALCNITGYDLLKARQDKDYIEGYDARFLAQEKTRRGIDFKKAFGVLSDDKKEVLLLVGAEGFSYAEASEITGAAVGTVKSRVNRARSTVMSVTSVMRPERITSSDCGSKIMSWKSDSLRIRSPLARAGTC